MVSNSKAHESSIGEGFDNVIGQARMGYFGVRRKWKALNVHFPGHGISVEAVCCYE